LEWSLQESTICESFFGIEDKTMKEAENLRVPSYFIDFLKEIRLTDNQVSDLITGHTTLRTRLFEDETLSKIIVCTFLQGSYRRATAVRPKGDSRSDVDVIVVTKLSKDEYTPEQALNVFVPFCEKHYEGKYRIQGRSIGISLSYVDLDIVITAAPSESQEGILESESVRTDESLDLLRDWKLTKSWIDPINRTARTGLMLESAKNEEEWKTEPLFIPNREAEKWEETDPLAQIKWTWEKNGKCNGHYINVVKALKWWRREKFPDAGQPKSYPLEHFIGQCCPDGIEYVADGVVFALENMVKLYPEKPYLADHGVPTHDVFARLTDDEYKTFYEQVCTAANIARKAIDATDTTESVTSWQELFGSKFPSPPKKKECSEGGYTPRTEPSTIGGGRFGQRK
jgi:hypothetical protein